MASRSYQDEVRRDSAGGRGHQVPAPEDDAPPAVRLTLLLLSTASAPAPLPRPTVRPVVFPELTSHP